MTNERNEANYKRNRDLGFFHQSQKILGTNMYFDADFKSEYTTESQGSSFGFNEQINGDILWNIVFMYDNGSKTFI